MSELTEGQWAVVSERGTEATSLTYAQAREKMRTLLGEKVAGLSIITAEAAGRSSHVFNSRGRRHASNGDGKKQR